MELCPPAGNTQSCVANCHLTHLMLRRMGMIELTSFAFRLLSFTRPKCPQPSWPNTSNSFQSHLDFPNDSESEFDCLNLFITRPSNKALARIEYVDRKLPVLIWIHGGGYGFGAATDPMWGTNTPHSLLTELTWSSRSC